MPNEDASTPPQPDPANAQTHLQAGGPLGVTQGGGLINLSGSGPVAIPDQPPQQVGHYQLREELGRGGMGVVYRAFDTRLGREVALKTLISLGNCSPERLDRFQREVRAAAMLDHPHIVKVLDVGELDGIGPYYTMEFLQGEDMAESMESRQLHPREAVAIIEQASLAVGAAHTRSILHRDIKPQNIFLRHRADETGEHLRLGSDDSGPRPVEALVVDFGLAKLAAADTADGTGSDPNHALTQSGEMLGTPLYMAPEQMEGAHEVDETADIYSLGATLYHALTERPPFEAETLPNLVMQVLKEDPVPPRRINHKLDRDLETMCLKCLAKEPRQRYQSAWELAEDCRRYLAGEPLVARPIGPMVRLFRRARRNRATLAALTAALILGLSAAVGVYWRYVLQPRWQAEAEGKRLAAEAKTRRDEARALLKQGQAALKAGELAKARELAERLIERYARPFDLGEDLPIPRAHLLLSRVADQRQEKQQTLKHLFRAYSLAAGRSERGELLLEVGLQLERMGRFSDAQGCLIRALGLAEGKQRLTVRFALARCQASLFQFDEAHRQLEALAGQLTGARFERWRRLAASMTPVTRHPIQFVRCVVRDVDGDGRPEVVGIHTDGKQVVVGHFIDGVWKEIARRRLLTTEPFDLGAIEAIDLDADGSREIIVTGGRAHLPKGIGRLFVLGLDGGALVERATAPLSQGVLPGTLAYADLDGDGKKELLVGTGHYERAVRLYRYLPNGPGLKLLGAFNLKSDVCGLLVRDANKNGRPELWVFAGPWNAYGLIALEFNPARRKYDMTITRLGEDYLIADLDPQGSDLELLVGHAWSMGHLRSRWKVPGGRAAFERSWPPPGVQRLVLGPDLKARVFPLDRPPWPARDSPVGAQQGGFHARRGFVGRLGHPADRWVWTWVGRLEDRRATPLLRLGYLDGPHLRHWGWLRLPSTRYLDAQAADLDGDGDLEVLIPGGKAAELAPDEHMPLVVLGLGKPPAPNKSPGRAGGDGGQHDGRLTGDVSLTNATLAERLGLLEQAASAYRKVLKQTRQIEILQQASVGLVRVLFARGKPDEAEEVANRLLARHPSLREPLGHATLTGLENSSNWAAAHRMARYLLETPGLSREEVARLRTRAESLRALARPATRLDERSPGWQLLPRTPLPSWRASPGSVIGLRGNSRCQLPLAMEGDSYDLRVDLRVTRKAWGMGVGVGLHAGGSIVHPMQATTGGFGAAEGRHRAAYGPVGVGHVLMFHSAGHRETPVTVIEVRARRERGRPLPSRYLLHIDDLRNGDTLQLRLAYVPHLRRLVAGVKHTRTGREGRVVLEDVPPLIDSPFLDLWTKATHTRMGQWGAFEVTRLSLRAGRVQVRPSARRARTGLDLLMQANGKAMQGRREEAQRLYDQAVQVGDLERSKYQALATRKLPGLHELPWATPLRSVSVEARVWRAFLLWQCKKRQPALEDLRAAHQLAPEAVKLVLLEAAPYLLDQPERAGLMVELLKELHRKADQTSALRDWVAENWSADCARLLSKR